MIETTFHPTRDTVLYDGQCRFCRSQIAILKALSLGHRLDCISFHTGKASELFPEISHDQLMQQMYVVDPHGRARGGADAVRYLSRQIPLLWPLALLLHIPGSLPLWRKLYAFIARYRLSIAGSCSDGECRLPPHDTSDTPAD